MEALFIIKKKNVTSLYEDMHTQQEQVRLIHFTSDISRWKLCETLQNYQ